VFAFLEGDAEKGGPFLSSWGEKCGHSAKAKGGAKNASHVSSQLEGRKGNRSMGTMTREGS